MADPTVVIKRNPLDLPLDERVRQFNQELAETAPEDKVKVYKRYLDPDPKVIKGVVARSSDTGTRLIRWQDSHFDYHAPGTVPRADAFTPKGLPRAVVPLKNTGGSMAFKHPEPKRRDPLVRVESMMKRYKAEYDKGNHAVLASLLVDCQNTYWKAGMPVTLKALQDLAAESLRIAEAKRAAQNYKRVTKEVIR